MVIYLSSELEEQLSLDELTPRQIVAELDKHVVGQSAAKRAVAVAYYEENMVPVVALQPIIPEPPPVAVVPEPLVPPLIPPTPIAPQES